MDLCESSGDYDYSGDDSDVIISKLIFFNKFFIKKKLKQKNHA